TLSELDPSVGGPEFESEAVAAVEALLDELRAETELPQLVHIWRWRRPAVSHTDVSVWLGDEWDQITTAPQVELRRLLHTQHAADPELRGAIIDALEGMDVEMLRAAVHHLVEQWFESSADQGAA
ncbi:MAG: hypothetical protein ABGZ17_25650, partial [Planctomycetaceae bacterium]